MNAAKKTTNADRKMSAMRPRKLTAERKIRNLTEDLSREEYGMGLRLLDAAVAGMILGFKPDDREMRTMAGRCWAILKPQLNRHLMSEDETVLPWAEGAGLAPAVAARIKQRHRQMRSFIEKLDGVSFEKDPDVVVAPAGNALCALVVKLDDLIDSEEMRLLPTLRRMSFAQPE